MKNTITDHSFKLKNDLIPREKAQSVNNRRRRNKVNADEFKLKPNPVRLQTQDEYAIAANVDDNGVLINPVNAADTKEQPPVHAPEGNIF
jgi:hypothetical protein